MGSRRANGEHIAGKLGADLTLEQGYEAARWAALNLLARMKAELGDLDRVSRILKVVGMVNSDPAFTDQAAVVDGASDLFVALYGERGQHARSAPGMAVTSRQHRRHLRLCHRGRRRLTHGHTLLTSDHRHSPTHTIRNATTQESRRQA